MQSPDTDTITRTITRHLTARPAWDESPALLAIGPPDTGIPLIQVEVPRLAWEDPAGVLEAYAAANAPAHPVPAADARVWGLALRYEAFTTEITADRRRTGAATPTRIESRIAVAVDTSGTRYALCQRRDTGEVESLFTVAGAIPTALQRLLAAFYR